MTAAAVLRSSALVVLSPTRLAYKCFKKMSATPNRFARVWPVAFLIVEAVLATTLALISPQIQWLSALTLGWLATSRIIEIALAYYTDSMGSLRGDEKSTDLGPVERIQFAMMSYLSLLFLWAFLYYTLPLSSFCPKLDEFVNALYFSGVTITTLGYGDVLPHSWYAKLLCLIEVLSGLLVLVVAVASYLAGVAESRNAR
jgi:hypothetical protein